MKTLDLRALKPIIKLLPEIKAPEKKPILKIRLYWVGFALLIFAILGVIKPVGMATVGQSSYLSQLQLITASKIGSLATLGIGPIVMASIILQLLMGAKIININLQDEEQKRLYQGLQKLSAILFAFFEAGIYVMSGFVPAQPGIFNTTLVILQLAFAAIILLYLDELISKYGIGSGIGLFIAGGVSFRIIWRAFSWVKAPGTATFIGLIPQLFQGIMTGNIPETAIFPLISTIVVFLAVVFAEAMKIEIPLTFGRIKGGAKYPLKFLYVSNIPVIFAAALIANIQLLGIALQGFGWPLLGKFVNNRPISGISYYLKSPYGALANPSQIAITLSSPQTVLNIIIYSIILIILCILFGKFWVEISGMSSKEVAKQLQQVGLHVPGFRRDPRVVENVLNRYIPVITVVGSAAVGLLAIFADLTGALGTGTGILLTVGILYKMYEELAAQQAEELMPMLKNLIG